MKRIAVDMDEVLAKYTEKVIKQLHQDTGYVINLNDGSDKITGTITIMR